MRWNVSGMARQFIAGRNPDDVMKTLRKKRRQKIGFTVDLLGEAVVSEEEANDTARDAWNCSSISPAKREAGPIHWAKTRSCFR